MDILDSAAEVVANLFEKGQAVAAVLGGAVIYLVRAKAESDKRAEKRTDQMIALIDSTNDALHPIGDTLQAGREAIARLETAVEKNTETMNNTLRDLSNRQTR